MKCCQSGNKLPERTQCTQQPQETRPGVPNSVQVKGLGDSVAAHRPHLVSVHAGQKDQCALARRGECLRAFPCLC